MFLRVAIFSSLRQSFDYLLPSNLAEKPLKTWIRVKVPFGKRSVIGIILEIMENTSVASEKIKPIECIIDEEPIFSSDSIELIKWTSKYYHHSIGDVVCTFLPKALRGGKTLHSCVNTCTNNRLEAEPTLHLTKTFIELNEEQQLAVDSINTTKGFQAFLLEGVTGSGKTEVYLQVIAKIIASGKQALVLVPEIGLTPQTVARFRNRFTENIVVFHSKLSDRERLQAWILTKNNEAAVVIGTRSAVLAPLTNLGVIILDEEHDASFKQQAGLRYSARNLALLRGKLTNIPVVMGSATPSLDSIYNANRGLYTRLTLSKRAGKAVPPVFRIIDLRGEKNKSGITTKLQTKIQEHLDQNGQILLFLNQRGYAPVLICHNCGWIAMCKNCDAKLTLHQKPDYLQCHLCGYTTNPHESCLSCGDRHLVKLGVGTERLEENLKELFPNTSLIRIDRDTTRRKNAMEEILADVYTNQSKILLGTQMLAKGHHFPNVTMAAIINIDNGLLSSDFRAVEHTAQLVMQVAGRAGRVEKVGEIYIQTYNPEHPLLRCLIEHGYQKFAEETLKERRVTKLPPFSYFAAIRAVAKDQQQLLAFLNTCKRLGENLTSAKIRLFGPISAAISKKAGYYHAHLLINSDQRSTLHTLLDRLIPHIENFKLASGVIWTLDIDPID